MRRCRSAHFATAAFGCRRMSSLTTFVSTSTRRLQNGVRSVSARRRDEILRLLFTDPPRFQQSVAQWRSSSPIEIQKRARVPLPEHRADHAIAVLDDLRGISRLAEHFRELLFRFRDLPDHILYLTWTLYMVKSMGKA